MTQFENIKTIIHKNDQGRKSIGVAWSLNIYSLPPGPLGWALMVERNGYRRMFIYSNVYPSSCSCTVNSCQTDSPNAIPLKFISFEPMQPATGHCPGADYLCLREAGSQITWGEAINIKTHHPQKDGWLKMPVFLFVFQWTDTKISQPHSQPHPVSVTRLFWLFWFSIGPT